MNAPLEAYPLTWPYGRPRRNRHARRDGDFTVPLAQARDELVRGLGLLDARGIVISSGMQLRRDGLPLAAQREPEDPGVACYFERRCHVLGVASGLPVGWSWRPFVIACDSYRSVRHNLRAIGTTVEALRAIYRHGATEMLEQAFTGFAALPAPKKEPTAWWEILGVPEAAGWDEISDRFKALAREHHPDLPTGDAVWFSQVSAAFQAAKEARGK